MVRSFGLGIPGTRNVYIFVPSIPRCVLLVIPTRERNFARYLNRFLPLYPNKTIVKRIKLITWVYR